MSELKPCPLCNCMAYSIPRNMAIVNGESVNIGWACGCNRCDLRLWGDTQYATEKRWNTRSELTRLQTERGELIEDICNYQSELARLTAELAELRERTNQECHWTEEVDGEYWDTECDGAFVFEVETPKANNYNFCPKCGRKLVEMPLPEPPEADND